MIYNILLAFEKGKVGSNEVKTVKTVGQKGNGDGALGKTGDGGLKRGRSPGGKPETGTEP